MEPIFPADPYTESMLKDRTFHELSNGATLIPVVALITKAIQLFRRVLAEFKYRRSCEESLATTETSGEVG